MVRPSLSDGAPGFSQEANPGRPGTCRTTTSTELGAHEAQQEARSLREIIEGAGEEPIDSTHLHTLSYVSIMLLGFSSVITGLSVLEGLPSGTVVYVSVYLFWMMCGGLVVMEMLYVYYPVKLPAFFKRFKICFILNMIGRYHNMFLTFLLKNKKAYYFYCI